MLCSSVQPLTAQHTHNRARPPECRSHRQWSYSDCFPYIFKTWFKVVTVPGTTSRPCWFATARVQARDPSSTRQEQTVGAPVASIPRRVLDEHHLPSSLPVSIYKYNRVLAADAPWCLVFNNVESHEAVIQHRPTGGNGKTLVTSRNSISVAEGDAIACRSGKSKVQAPPKSGISAR